MNKKFFQTMKTFATVLLVVGLISATIVFFTTAFVTVTTSGHYYDHTETAFSWAGFASTVDIVLITVAGYFLLSGVARMGIKSFADEENTETENEKPTGKRLDSGEYHVGTDIPSGEYYVYADEGASGGKVTVINEDGSVRGECELSETVCARCTLQNGTSVCFSVPVIIKAVEEPIKNFWKDF